MLAIPEHIRGAFTVRRYANPRLPLPLPLLVERLTLCVNIYLYGI